MATRRGGRPTVYTLELSDDICEHLAGGKSLVSWCAKPGHPKYTTVARWLREDEEFQQRYVRAREAQADYLAEEVVEIADKVRHAVKKTVHTEPGKDDTKKLHTEEVHLDAVERSRLMMDARKWYAAKLAPKKYGDKVAIGGASDLPPLQTEARIDVGSLTPEQLRALASIPVQSR